MEEPDVPFTIASLGPVGPSDLDADVGFTKDAVEMMEIWASQGVHYWSTMESDDVAEMILAVFTTPIRVNDFLVEPAEGGPHPVVRRELNAHRARWDRSDLGEEGAYGKAAAHSGEGDRAQGVDRQARDSRALGALHALQR